jgi:hypothetical protein
MHGSPIHGCRHMHRYMAHRYMHGSPIHGCRHMGADTWVQTHGCRHMAQTHAPIHGSPIHGSPIHGCRHMHRYMHQYMAHQYMHNSPIHGCRHLIAAVCASKLLDGLVCRPAHAVLRESMHVCALVCAHA